MRLAILILVALSLTACASGNLGTGAFTNQTDLVNAIANDAASNCVVVNTPYGGILLARGTPGAKVTLAGGSCSIEYPK